jgi:hypothetical protein
MKKLYILFSLLALGLCAGAISAQSTTVSMTIQDPTSQVFANGYITYVFAGTPGRQGPYQWDGANLPAQYLTPTTVNLDGTGSASFSLPSNTAITPANSTWLFVICSNTSFRCSSLNLSVGGATQNLSSVINSALVAINLPAATMPRAYSTSEITLNPTLGGTFYNTTTGCMEFWNGTAWGCLASASQLGNYLSLVVTSPQTVDGPIAFNGGDTASPAITTLSNLGGVSLVNTSPQTMAGPLNAPILQQVINVQQYCTTPGTLNDSCFTNAIAYVVAHGVSQNPGPRLAYEIHVSVGTYNFANTVTVPYGINISIKGDYQSGVWGSIINVGSMTTPAFLIQADNVDIHYLSFQGSAVSGSAGIQLGDATHETYDSRIENNWFSGPYLGINCFNASGIYITDDTFDAGTPFGIRADHSAGALACQYTVADSGNRFYAQSTAIYLNGISSTDTTGAFAYNRWGGIFDHDGNVTAPDIELLYVQHNTIRGTFVDNGNNDISLGGGTGNVVGPFTSYHPGQYFLYANSENFLTISNGSINGANYANNASSMGAITLVSTNHVTVSGITEFRFPSATSMINYGLYSDSGSVYTLEYGNQWTDYLTAPTDILNSTVYPFSSASGANFPSYQLSGTPVTINREVVHASYIGSPTSSLIFGLFNNDSTTTISIPSGCTNSTASSRAAATSSAVFALYACTSGIIGGCTQFGSVTFAASSNTGTFSCTSAATIPASGGFLIAAPATPDATLGSLAFSIYGTHN